VSGEDVLEVPDLGDSVFFESDFFESVSLEAPLLESGFPFPADAAADPPDRESVT
jgi:hypothetical protein